MSDPQTFDVLVERIVAGGAPLNVRSAAARGALPLPRGVLVRLYVVLLDDPDEGVRKSAQDSLAALDVEGVRVVLDEPSCVPEVLLYFAKRAAREEPLAEKIAFHPAAPDAAIALLAGSGTTAVIDLVMTNQQRLLQRPALLERLMVNPALRADQQGRILEMLDRAVKIGAESDADGDEPRRAATDDEGEDLVEAARLLEVDVGDLLSASEILGAEELEHSDDPKIRTAYHRIVTLSAAQKAILAMKGGREERMILIHDTNKVVAMGVLKNPRLTELEVVAVAKMRNVTDDVLRQVGANRDWAKTYAVILGLISNPRTPQGVSMNFIPRLTNRDLKALATSREVPELIRRVAKRTHDTRTQKQGRSYRKK